MAADDLGAFLAHGGRVAAARTAFGGADWIDLSTGIAPWAYPVEGVPLELDRLPDPDALAALEAAAAEAFGVADARQVVAVPGSDLALRLLARVIPARRPAVVRPGYGGHAAAWPDAVAVDPHQPIGDRDLLVLASPANPTGATVPAARLIALAQAMTVVVDEAYADPVPALAPQAGDRMVVLRSFGKFYGLPGVRLGFVVAGDTIVAGLRALLGDWPVGGAAVALGTRAYADAGWQAAQTARIAAAGAALDRVLAAAGVSVIGAAPLFRLVETADGTALFRALARHAILTRPFADNPGWLRIGLPADEEGLARLARALEERT